MAGSIVFDAARWSEDSSGFWLSLHTTDRATAISWCESVKTPHVAEIKQKKKNRSLDANAYMWVLLDKLSAVLRIEKTEIYKRMVKEIGGASEVVCVKNEAVNKLCDGWRHNGIGWQTDTFQSKIEGCTNVILYYGSSTYDTVQMSRLVDLVVQECKQHGIETLTPSELERMGVVTNGG